MAYLEIISSQSKGKTFAISNHSILIVSSIKVVDVETILVEDKSVKCKHAAFITDSKAQLYQVMDLCSGTAVKFEDEHSFMELDPLKLYSINDSDEIRCGNVAFKLCVPDTVESSQPSLKTSKFYAPETETLTNSEHIESFTEIPATQDDSELVEVNEQISGTELDIVSEVFVSKERQTVEMSQDIFGEVQGHSKGNTTNHLFSDDEDDDGLDEALNEQLRRQITKEVIPALRGDSEAPNIPDAREGSITPDLDFPIKAEPITQPSKKQQQEFIQTQLVNLSEPEVKPQLPLQEDIETQLVDQETQDFMIEPTQPIFLQRRETRFHLKRQAEIKPPTVSLTDFEKTQMFEPSPPKKPKYVSMETQPIFVGKVKAAKPIDNKILLSSEDEDSMEGFVTSAARIEKPKKNISSQNRILDSTDDESDQDLRSKKKLSKIPKEKTQSLDDNIDITDDESDCPRLPSDSQIIPFLEQINQSQPSNDSALVMFESMVEDKKYAPIFDNQQPTTSKNGQGAFKEVKKIRRKIMKYGSDSDDEAMPTKDVKKTKDQVERNHKDSKKGHSSKQAVNDEESKENKKSTTNKADKTAKTSRKSQFYKYTITNIYDRDLLHKYRKIASSLGGSEVEGIKEADVLLTSDKIKLTAKVLFAICKGMPIVSEEFFLESKKAKKWLNPFDFTVSDSEMESKKGVNLKQALLKSKSKKFLQGYSVFIADGTKIPRNDIEDMITAAGGEIVRGQKPTQEKLVLLHGKTSKIADIIKNYPSVKLVQDSTLSTIILQQKL